MDLKQIEKLMFSMVRSGISRLALKQEGFEIEMERTSAEAMPSAIPPAYSMPLPASEQPQQPSKAEEKHEDFVSSPMVGTYFAAPSPEDPPFVKVGDQVDEDTVVCIIEAMKVMNEVKAGKKGKISAALLSSGDPVEFGTKIFRIQ